MSHLIRDRFAFIQIAADVLNSYDRIEDYTTLSKYNLLYITPFVAYFGTPQEQPFVEIVTQFTNPSRSFFALSERYLLSEGSVQCVSRYAKQSVVTNRATYRAHNFIEFSLKDPYQTIQRYFASLGFLPTNQILQHGVLIANARDPILKNISVKVFREWLFPIEDTGRRHSELQHPLVPSTLAPLMHISLLETFSKSAMKASDLLLNYMLPSKVSETGFLIQIEEVATPAETRDTEYTRVAGLVKTLTFTDYPTWE